MQRMGAVGTTKHAVAHAFGVEPGRAHQVASADAFRYVAVVGGLAVAYILVGKAGLLLASLHPSASPVWPATGLAVAALLVFGVRVWPAVALGAFVVNATTAGNAWTSLAIAAGNTLEAVVAALLVRRFAGGRAAFDRAETIFAFAALAGLGATTISATIGVTALTLGGYAAAASFGPTWLTWWLGDAVGAIVVTPFLLLLADRAGNATLRRRPFEAAAVALTLVGGGALVFLGPFGLDTIGLPVTFVLLPVLVWAAYRFGPRETSVAVMLLSAMALGATITQRGPFAGLSANASLLLQQSFMGVATLTCLPLATVVRQRRDAERALKESHEDLERRVRERTRELEEALALHRATLDSTADGILVVDRAGRVTSHNRQFLEMWAIPPELAATRDDDRLLHHVRGQLVDADGFRAKVRDLYAHPDEDSFDILTFRDGRVFERASRPQQVGSDIVGRVWNFRDVTRRRQAEDTERRLAAVVGSSHDAIVAEDLDGTIRSWNAGAERLFGYAAREAVGRPAAFLLPPDRPDEERRILERVRRGESVVAFESLRRRKDGTTVEVAITVSPIRDAAGRVIGAAKIARDITDRKRAEREYVARVEQAVEVDRLKELDRFRTLFVNTAAHELRNPLTPLRLELHALKKGHRGPLTAAQADSLDVLDRNLRRLAVLVEDMLDAARMQSGRLRIDAAPLDLASTLDDAAALFRAPAERGGLDLSVDVRGPLPLVGDAARLSQVVANLLDNAIKFTPRGGRIRLEARREDDVVVVSVVDTGLGLPADGVAKLFQPFSQVHDLVERPRLGSGLGLFISRSIVELHGGTIRAESAGPGKGARFTVRLPAA